MIGSGYQKLRGLLKLWRDGSRNGSGVESNVQRELRGKLQQKNQKLDIFRERLKKKNRRIEELRVNLDHTRSLLSSARLGQNTTPVFFVVGQPKSGTSWLMWTLNVHPEILCTGEGHLFGRNFKREDIKAMRDSRVQPSSLYRAILDADYLNAWVERSVWSQGDKDRHLNNLTRLAVQYFMNDKLSQTGKRIVGDKTPFSNLVGEKNHSSDSKIVEEIGTIYPGSKVIHIIRDGRDVAVSWAHHAWNHAKQDGGVQDVSSEKLAKRDRYRADPQTFLKEESLFVGGELAEVAENWAKTVRRAREDGLEYFDGNYAEVRYEDLLERPYQQVYDLLRFLEADASDEVVETCVKKTDFQTLSKGRSRGEENSSSAIRKGVSGDWENVFTEEDKTIFKRAAGDLLVELGYEKNHDW